MQCLARAGLVGILGLGSAACATPSTGRADQAIESHLDVALASVDWATRLFPDGPTPPPPAVTPPVVETPDPPAGVFASSEYMVNDDTAVQYKDVAEFCKERVGCSELPLPVTFHASSTFRALRAIRVVESSYSYSTLLVHVKDGVAPLPVSWNVADPEDPGCPSIVRKIGIEEVRIENGLLVVVGLGVSTTWVEPPENSIQDSGARSRLVRTVALVKADGSELHTRTFESMGGPALGEIVQPGARNVPWEKLHWQDRRMFSVTADGTLEVASK